MNNFLCEYLTFAAAFARILGTYKERDKLEKDQNSKNGDKTCSKVCSPVLMIISALTVCLPY